MSVIVAIKDNNRIVIGVDVRMSCSETYIDSYKRRPKALHLNNSKDIVVGAVGNAGLVDILRQQLLEYETNDLYKIDRPYIVKYIIPALIRNVRDYDMTDKEGKMDGALFLAIKNKAFSISGNYVVDEILTYYAEGSGREAALGSLYTTEKMPMTPEERIKIAIESAGSCISSVSKVSYIGDTSKKPFQTTTLENKKK